MGESRFVGEAAPSVALPRGFSWLQEETFALHHIEERFRWIGVGCTIALRVPDAPRASQLGEIGGFSRFGAAPEVKALKRAYQFRTVAHPMAVFAHSNRSIRDVADHVPARSLIFNNLLCILCMQTICNPLDQREK